MQKSKVRSFEKLKSGNGYFVTLENGAARYVNPPSPPYVGQIVTAASFAGGSNAEWTFQ